MATGRGVPQFEPHPMLRGGHLQTIAGRYLPGRPARLPSTYHEIRLEDGDRLAVFDSEPAGWVPGSPAAVLIHGLSGCARAPYVVRLAARLLRNGVRVVRMNLRGAGAGWGLARGIYHSGRTEDMRAVVEWAARRMPGSPIALVGFSLGANLALLLAAEASERPVPGLDCVLAANPPFDLRVCCEAIREGRNRLYDWNFVRSLRREIEALHRLFPDLGPPRLDAVRSLYDFDDAYTAPRNGFTGAADYYARCSCGPRIAAIRLPGLVVHAADDPFVPPDALEGLAFPPRLALELIPSGGHLGYLSRTPWDGDRRWLDARLAAWLDAHWRPNARDGVGVEIEDTSACLMKEGGPTAHVLPQVQ